MSLHEYYSSVVRYWRYVVVVVILTTGVSLGYILATPPSYSTSARVFVSSAVAANLDDIAQGTALSQQVVGSIAQLATSPAVLNPVIKRLKLRQSAAELVPSVSAEAIVGTSVMDITVLRPNPRESADIANAIASQLQVTVDTVTPRLGSTSSAIRVSVIQVALPESSTKTPKTLNSIVVGVALGLLLGIAAALIRGLFGGKLHSAQELARLAPAPLIGVVPRVASKEGALPLVVPASATSFNDSIRGIRTALKFVVRRAEGRAILVTSSTAGEGKTTIAYALAWALAQSGAAVILVDADLRRPRITPILGLDQRLGLTDAVADGRLLEACLVGLDGASGSFRLLPSGSSAPNPAELLQSTEMKELLASMVEMADYVIVDSAPLLPVEDTVGMLPWFRSILLVAAVNKATTAEIARALHKLESLDATPIGTVASMASPKRPNYGYNYGYSSPVTMPV